MRVERYGAASLALRFPARPGELRSVRSALRERLASWGLDAACTRDVVLAVDEACQNVIRHAYRGRADGSIELGLRREADELRITLFDRAPRSDPARFRSRRGATLRPGGLGLHLMHSVMDRCEFGAPPCGPGNLLRMSKRLRARKESSAMRHALREECGTLIVSFAGEVDLEHAQQAREILLDQVGRRRRVLVDLSDVEFIDSSGIASLLEALQKATKAGTGFGLAAPSPAAARVLELTRLDRVFPVFGTLAEAMALVAAVEAAPR